MKELFDDIEKLRAEFESIERPILEMETPAQENSPREVPPKDVSSSETHPPAVATKSDIDQHHQSATVMVEQTLDHEAELAKLESEFGKVGQDYSTEEIGDWEFDELERELTTGDSATSR